MSQQTHSTFKAHIKCLIKPNSTKLPYAPSQMQRLYTASYQNNPLKLVQEVNEISITLFVMGFVEIQEKKQNKNKTKTKQNKTKKKTFHVFS